MSNDIMCSLLNTILDALGCNDNNRTITGRVIEQKIQLINNKITSMQEQYNNATGFYKLYLGLEMQYNISLINNAVYSTQVIDGYSELYKTNFKGIINEIKKINPTAKIYIGNLYNPYKEISPIKIGSYTVLDVGNIVETWELNYNNIIRNVAKEYPIVDLHSVITSSSQLNGDYDPHPNSVGYQDIANAFLKIMK